MTREFATYLVSECKKKILGTQLLVDELQDLWGGSRAHIYKKMKGEAPITLQEALDAAKHYGFSLDEFIAGQSDQVFFVTQRWGAHPKPRNIFSRNCDTLWSP